MPLAPRIVKTEDFVRFDAHGKIDFARSREVLATIAKACLDNGIDCALLDTRDLQPDKSVGLGEMYALVSVFNETGFQRNHKLAILHRYRAGERAEFFALCATQRGWNVRAFEEFEEAMGWFSEVEPKEEIT